jgi:hypothetical protein
MKLNTSQMIKTKIESDVVGTSSKAGSIHIKINYHQIKTEQKFSKTPYTAKLRNVLWKQNVCYSKVM